MNCEHARNRILGLTNPAALPDTVKVHLAGCVGCKIWHRLLVQVEGGILTLPVPPTSGQAKRQLVERFRSTPQSNDNELAFEGRVETRPEPRGKIGPKPVAPARPRTPVGERLARLWPLGLVAAAVLVAAVSWSMLGTRDPGPGVASLPRDPMLKEVVSAKVKLDRASTPAGRLDALASLAVTIHQEARELAKVSPGEDMESLASMYQQVVQDGLILHAAALGNDERRATLPRYVEQLREAENLANRLAAEVPVGSDRPLREIAETAKSGRIELSRLIHGKAT